MKSLKLIRLVSLLAVASFGLTFAADKKDTPAEGKAANCCAKAAKAGKTCEHECCVDAAKAGKNCERCGGSGTVASPEAKK